MELKEALREAQPTPQETEPATIARILREVQSKVGMAHWGTLTLKRDVALLAYVGNHTAGASVTKEGESKIVYTAGILAAMGPYILYGILAHELGHVFYGDVQAAMNPFVPVDRHASELRADQFAARHGFGENLIASFEWAIEEYNVSPWFGNRTHPPLAQRIGALREYLNLNVNQERKAA